MPPTMLAMSLSRDEVAHLGRLARLALTEDELDHYTEQIGVILRRQAEHARALQQLFLHAERRLAVRGNSLIGAVRQQDGVAKSISQLLQADCTGLYHGARQHICVDDRGTQVGKIAGYG